MQPHAERWRCREGSLCQTNKTVDQRQKSSSTVRPSVWPIIAALIKNQIGLMVLRNLEESSRNATTA
ncbi:hypothetical protein KIN20_032785 [Parelaphostrongylus tenuis]|uniref:Uncharacterized protein n=1 Tax=Parelaphostrongylus tenuis TaxID=148309 RepID=A0AAD5R798_PARTN|nr:hypothetical protein KIN20_032785 [Parelaphostrongylus tenuis]